MLSDPSVPAAKRISPPELRDHVPELLDAIAAALDRNPDAAAVTAGRDVALSILPHSHAIERVAAGYSITGVLRELEHLRAKILEVIWRDPKAFDPRSVRFVHVALDECMTIAAVEMERARASDRERFVGVLGHDLRTPLNAIKMAASLLAQDPPWDKRRVFTQKILQAADRMNRMIRDLLDFATARSGAIVLERRACALKGVCAEVIGELRLAHPHRTVTFTADGDGRDDWDAARLAQVVSNLVGNALKYSPAGTPVSVVLHERPGAVEIDVHNEGAPIAKSDQAHIFSPFRRGRHRRSDGGGVGLGLFIAREMVQAHGGTVSVASEPHAGTTFRVVLPRRPP